jgi:uncharacterized protein DUF1524
VKLKRLKVPGTAVLAAVVAALVWTSSDGSHGRPDDSKGLSPAGPVATAGTVPYSDALQVLTVAPEGPHAGYNRERFALYQDADGNGCDARREVLIRQAKVKPKVEQPHCQLIGGEWISPYDGKQLTSIRDIQIDHMVPLSEAWGSGAAAWPTKRLVEYGSYLDDPGHLVAVSGPSNQDKSDKDPAEWMPPNKDFACTYLSDWVGVKIRWGLTADPKEMNALKSHVSECGKQPVRLP